MRQTTPSVKLLVLLGAVAMLVGCNDASSEAQADQAGTGSDVVAKVGDTTITLEEVDDKAKSISLKPYQALYDARRQAIEQIVNDMLLEQEATARGITQDELFNLEVTEKTPPVSDGEIETFFNQNKGRMGGRTLEQMAPQIRDYLASQKISKTQADFLTSLKSKSGLKVTLDPPRVDVVVAANDHVRGPSDAPVTIVEYSDFQ